MERECLTLLLRARQPVIICPPRSINGMRISSEWREPLQENRLLLLSPFPHNQRRATAETAMLRNRFVASLADEIFIAHAAPGSRTEAFCKELLAQGKPVLTFESPHNAHLIALGARAIAPD